MNSETNNRGADFYSSSRINKAPYIIETNYNIKIYFEFNKIIPASQIVILLLSLYFIILIYAT